MRVLIVHNQYRTPGGEEGVVDAEARLLQANGHNVQTLFRSSALIDRFGVTEKFRLLKTLAWSDDAAAVVKHRTRAFRADVVHFHNTHPLWSPSVFSAAHEAGAATVLTLHNFRLICMNAVMARHGTNCSECLDKGPWRGILHGCAPGSLFGSLAMHRMQHINRHRNTWIRDVDAFIALTPVNSKQIFEKAGLPADRIFVKPNFIDDPLVPSSRNHTRHGALCVGNLVEFKGTEFLINAWRGIDYPLTIVGSGPLEQRLRKIAPGNVTLVGRRPLADILSLMASSSFVVFPSTAREGFPRVIIESFAMGCPIVASAHGAMAEIVEHHSNGILYKPGDVGGLGDALRLLIGNPDLARQLGTQARREYISKYTSAINHGQLLAIYGNAIAHFKTRGTPARDTSRPPLRSEAESQPEGGACISR